MERLDPHSCSGYAGRSVGTRHELGKYLPRSSTGLRMYLSNPDRPRPRRTEHPTSYIQVRSNRGAIEVKSLFAHVYHIHLHLVSAQYLPLSTSRLPHPIPHTPSVPLGTKLRLEARASALPCPALPCRPTGAPARAPHGCCFAFDLTGGSAPRFGSVGLGSGLCNRWVGGGGSVRRRAMWAS